MKEEPAAAAPAHPLVKIATVGSADLADILRRMDVDSINFDAEVLGKLLGAETSGNPSIAGAASAIRRVHRGHTAHQGSRTTMPWVCPTQIASPTQGMVRLLWFADRQPWAPELRFALPTGGQGTLEGRLGHLRLAGEDRNADRHLRTIRLGVV